MIEAYGKGTFTYAYDAVGRQTSVLTPQLQATTIGYDPVGRLVERQFANWAVTTQAYDAAGNVLGISNQGPAGLVSQFAYTYDDADHRLTQAESDGTVTTWTYDGGVPAHRRGPLGRPRWHELRPRACLRPGGQPGQPVRRDNGHHVHLQPGQPPNAGRRCGGSDDPHV